MDVFVIFIFLGCRAHTLAKAQQIPDEIKLYSPDPDFYLAQQQIAQTD